MPYLTVGKENSGDIQIHYTDHGEGQPVILIHGFPFSGAAWEKQESALLDEGHRVITYDRRGFGLSSHPSVGYDYNMFAKDLDVLITKLNLKQVTLVGHSMGTGELARYICTYGSTRISRAIFISPILPFLLKTSENTKGVDGIFFEEMKEAIMIDRFSFITEFLNKFYNNEQIFGKTVSEERLRADFNLASSASAIATLKCVDTWLTDFRPDISKISIPSLVIQGEADGILPIRSTGELLSKMLGAQFVRIPKGPHGIIWTHADIVNKAILDFTHEGINIQAPRKNNERGVGADLH